MCLTKPQKIKKVNGQVAELADGRMINVALIKKVKAGDWVLANANLALTKISDQEAKEINEYLK
ncbi:MAG: HypC/HybG/HupF family hydrogenase formation chaperone [Candidatus Buchananbacteria bacterium]